MGTRNFRHFHNDNERNTIDWADERVAVISTIEQDSIYAYANEVGGKLELLRSRDSLLPGAAPLLVAWPGRFRQDIFELDDETRKFAIKILEQHVVSAA